MTSWAQSMVRGATHGCITGGCAAPELSALARHLSDQAHEVLETLETKEGQAMVEPTRSLWCEQSGHSFSEKDPDMQVLSISGKDKEGKPVTESRTICGPCAVQTKTTLGGVRNVPAAELPA